MINNSFVLGAPQLPFGAPEFGKPVAVPAPSPSQHVPPHANRRALSFAADHGGCGFWRIHWPEAIINGNSLGSCSNMTFMLTDQRFYEGLKSVKVQRQVTPPQADFVKFLRQMADKFKFKLYYEIDDVVFCEDIPLYNKARDAFTDPVIKKTAIEIMKMCDAITCPTKFMGEYYTSRVGTPHIVLPNYMPKFWIDRYYSKAKVVENYDHNKKRPRVGYVGSPTHFNIAGVPNAPDDLDPIIPYIRKTYKDFKWVFMGGIPRDLVDLYKAGEVEYVPWQVLFSYPEAYDNLKLNFAIAPLQNNNFNLSKAPLKYLEAGALGIPCVCQDYAPYNTDPVASLRFNTPNELIDILKSVSRDRRHYLTESDRSRKVATQYWLEDHIEEHVKVSFPA